MATRVFSEFARANAAGEIDLNDAAVRIRIRLCMTNTTVGTDADSGITRNSNFTTIDEHGTAGQKELANKAVNRDAANGRAEFDADDVTYTALAAGLRDVRGVLVFYDPDGLDNDANNIPIAFLEYTTDKSPDGSDFTVKFDPEGILQLAI